jgi:hypothetical protein
LDATAQIHPGGDPREDIDVAPSSEAHFGYYGATSFGTKITGAFTINHVGDTWDIAQVVTPDVSKVKAHFYVSGENGGEIDLMPVPEIPGGPFSVDQGQSLNRWDLDGDGLCETDAGGNAALDVSWDYLVSMGRESLGTYDLTLEVIDMKDGYPVPEFRNGSLTVVPEPIALSLLAAGGGALLRKKSRR